MNDRNAGGGPPDANERDPRLDRLYGETERSVPPAHLDAAILAAARREVGARPRPLSSAVRRWRVPVSIAALVVLSVSVVTLVQQEGSDELMHVAPGPPAVSTPSEPAPAPAPSPAQPDAHKPSAAAPAARPRTAPPAPRDDERPGARGEVGAMSDSTRRDAVMGPATGAGTATVPEPAAKPAPQAFPIPRRAGEPEAERRARTAESGAPAAEEESAKALARSVPSKITGRVQAPAWQGYEKEPPQKWLERIAELRRQGETVAANEMVAEFKRRFPDHPLPVELDRP